jgi:LmbE family N-acetylglucosaminyl deacetylase
MNHWIYLSPHFDDVALSTGGLIWEQVRQGDLVEICTICAGAPPADKPLTDYAQMLQSFWELGDDATYARSLEDAAGCRRLGASYRRYTVPDNIYRYFPASDEPVVKVPDDNFGPLEPDEAYLIPPVTDFLRKNLPEDGQLVIPLAVGHHRDHVLTRTAAERLGIPLWHYIDFPYVTQNPFDLAERIPADAEPYSLPISPAGLQAWQDGFACYRSQLNMMWGYDEEMRAAIEEYWRAGQGATLWKF